MKCSLVVPLSLATLSLLLNVTFAQSTIQVNVPFAFNVGSSQLPPGSYKIRLDEMHDRIMIQNSATCATFFSHGRAEYPGDKNETLAFRHVGDRYFLTEVWGAQGSAGMKLQGTKLGTQIEIAKQPVRSGKEVIIAQK